LVYSFKLTLGIYRQPLPSGRLTLDGDRTIGVGKKA
jgi:hypothetical protein